MRLAGRHVVVMGLGRSGRAAAALALRHGASVTCVDRAATADPVPGATLRLGSDAAAPACDVMVVSPGVAAAHPDVAAARSAGVDVVGELGFAWRFVQPETIAVTGTNGKSTVTWFTGHLWRAAGREVFVGGNFGVPLSEAALGVAPSAAVIEVSSYQMELPGAFDPRAGVILNLTPDHLARHGTMEVYGQHKCRIFERMGPGDLAMIPAGDPVLAALASGIGRGERAWLGGSPGVRVEGDRAEVDLAGGTVVLDLSVVSVPGQHNRVHAATAAALVLHRGADPAAVQAGLASLTALAHRMEPVGTLDGVPWINDSKATNVDAAVVGLEGIDRPSVVLLGGEAKGPGFAALASALRRHPVVICFGGSGSQIADELRVTGIEPRVVTGMTDAMVLARELARPGQAVLLSPACASFDEFRNFEHRGEVFRAFVAKGGA